jgi:hypothetical protein
MAYEAKEGNGVLFVNKFKGDNPKSPDFTGNILINGVTLELAAWKKISDRGNFLSLFAHVNEKEQAAPAPKKAAAKAKPADDFTF